VQLEFLFRPRRQQPPDERPLQVAAQTVPLRFVRHPRARRYILRLDAGGIARVTVPRNGSFAEARTFTERQTAWLMRQLARQAAAPPGPHGWFAGTVIFFRGESVPLVVGQNGSVSTIRFADQAVPVADPAADLRTVVERHLWRLAACELPARVLELASPHALPVRRVTVRNQRSRWGSCSRRGTVSLNWRLVQTPPFVRDYLIFHELAHLRVMNHSSRFWQTVAGFCPDYQLAEQWLKSHGRQLR
jgi:predicted metal-dependent hydrolase